MDNFTEITLMEAYLDALAKDLSAPVPVGLDPDFAQFLRSMVANKSGRVSDIQARVWQKTFQAAQSIRAAQQGPTINTAKLTRRPAPRFGIFPALAAALIIIIASGMLLRAATSQYGAVPTNAASTSTIAVTETTIPTAISPTLEAFVPIPRLAETPRSGLTAVPISANNAIQLKITTRLSKGAIHQMIWSPDHKHLVVCSASGLWLYNVNALDGAGLHLDGYEGAMNLAVFSPDGRTIASAGDQAILLWDVSSGYAQAVLNTNQPASALAFSPDGKTLASGILESDARTIHLWNIASGKQSATMGTANGIASLVFSPDGSILASGDLTNAIRLWDVQTRAERAVLALPQSATELAPGAPAIPITALAFSSDGKLLASGSQSNWVRIWNVETHTLLHSRADVQHGVRSLSFSPGDRSVAYGDGESAWLWQFNTSLDPAFLDKVVHWKAVVYDFDGTPLAIGLDTNGWRLWGSKPDPQMLLGYTDDHPLTSLSLVGRQLAAGEKLGLTYFWDMSSGLPNGTLQTTSSTDIVLSANGKWLAAAQSSKIQLWDWAHGQYRLLQTVTGVINPNPLGTIQRLAFSPDGRLLASAGTGVAALVLWDSQSWDSKQVVVMQDSVTDQSIYALAFSLDSHRLVYRTANGIQLWDLARQTTLASFPLPAAAKNNPTLQSLAFSPDGQLIAYADGKTVHLWNAAAQKTIDLAGHSADVYNVAFSPDGTILASASADGSIRLWNRATSTLISSLRPEIGSIFDVTFSADGTLLLASGQSGVIYGWTIVD